MRANPMLMMNMPIMINRKRRPRNRPMAYGE
jgi:hypothetical protein